MPQSPTDPVMPTNSHDTPLALPREFVQSLYAELHALARRVLSRPRAADSPRTTSLAHRAWLKLHDTPRADPPTDPHQFSAIASTVLRSVIIDEARRQARAKRGGGWRRLPAEALAHRRDPTDEYPWVTGLLDLDAALSALGRASPRRARVVELRFFGGLSVPDTAHVLGIAERTVIQEWRLARAWLRARLDEPVPRKRPA